jgi:hypothetical protein
MNVIINPGTEPIVETSEKYAIENIEHFITDSKIKNLNWIRIPEHDYGNGRYAFLLWRGRHCLEIQMPGLPLSRVRYTGEPEQNIWNFPRLYTDGSSYVWQYAVPSESDFSCDGE